MMTGEELKRRRLLYSYGMSTFARKIGLKPSRLCDYEHGRAEIPSWLEERIEEFFSNHLAKLEEGEMPWDGEFVSTKPWNYGPQEPLDDLTALLNGLAGRCKRCEQVTMNEYLTENACPMCRLDNEQE